MACGACSEKIAAAAGETLGISTKGGLMVADNEDAMRWLRGKAELEKRWGVESHIVGANELRTLAFERAATTRQLDIDAYREFFDSCCSVRGHESRKRKGES